jgi:uncharacterized membrane protein YoaK (UPF0700 family)
MHTSDRAPLPTLPRLPLAAALRRVVLLSAAAGYVEITGFLWLHGLYPGIMTGNTVQLGFSIARGDWAQARQIGAAIALFFIGCVVGSVLRRVLRQPGWELLLAAALVVAADAAVHSASLRDWADLPLLAFAMALQGSAISRFGGRSIQTIVVTSSIVKFADALVGFAARWPRVVVRERVLARLTACLLPGMAWLSYSAGAAAGARLREVSSHSLLLAAAVFACVAFDMHSNHA